MKKYEPLTPAERKWIRATFSATEIEACELIWGGIPMDETFVKNNDRFKKLANRPPDTPTLL